MRGSWRVGFDQVNGLAWLISLLLWLALEAACRSITS